MSNNAASRGKTGAETGTGTRKENTVTRSQIVKEISYNEGVPAELAERIILSFVGHVKKHVNEGKAIELRGFGRFSTTVVQRQGFYPKEKVTDEIRFKTSVKFNPSKFFIKKVNNLKNGEKK